jgi:hypothetical protein
VLSIGFEKFRFLPFPVNDDVIIWYIIFSGEGEEDIIKEKKKEKESIHSQFSGDILTLYDGYSSFEYPCLE